MAPSQIPGPTRQPNRPPMARLNQRLQQVWGPLSEVKAYHNFCPLMNVQQENWLQSITDRFNHLIRLGESQPSNGSVRKIEHPDGETRFAVAYGEEPDHDLWIMLENIYAKHGEFFLFHDGRDSTGKHWIKCFTKVHPDPCQRLTEKAIICVFSKLEMATIPRLARAKDKAPQNGKKQPPKVPGAVKGAPDNLFFLPWYKQLPWLEPAAAQAQCLGLNVGKKYRERHRGNEEVEKG